MRPSEPVNADEWDCARCASRALSLHALAAGAARLDLGAGATAHRKFTRKSDGDVRNIVQLDLMIPTSQNVERCPLEVNYVVDPNLVFFKLKRNDKSLNSQYIQPAGHPITVEWIDCESRAPVHGRRFPSLQSIHVAVPPFSQCQRAIKI